MTTFAAHWRIRKTHSRARAHQRHPTPAALELCALKGGQAALSVSRLAVIQTQCQLNEPRWVFEEH